MIRPEPARWFEILAARDDAPLVLEALAATGAIELEARPAAVLPHVFEDLRPLLLRYAEFAQRYGAYWPEGSRRSPRFPEPPSIVLDRSLQRIGAWAADAEPLIRRLQQNAAERSELLFWRRALGALSLSAVDLGELAHAGPLLQVRLFVFPVEVEPTLPADLPVRRFVIEGMLHALAVGAADDLQPLALQTVALKGRSYELPRWLHADPAENAAYLATRLDSVEREQRELQANLDALHERHELRVALGDAGRLQWLIDNVRALETGELFCRITGWTSELAGSRLSDALERSGARALLHYPPPPHEVRAPLVLANPAWARPFEVFSRALGMPARNEADPTTILALIVPLLFGYMFGDLGQGLVIALAGFALRRRWALARLFITGGVAASVFGLLFGSVFSLHGLLPALWLEPLADPLTVLLVPLFGGAALLTVGLMLRALEAYWRHELRGWFCSEIWLAVVYLSILAGVVRHDAFWLAGAAAIAFCAGRAVAARKPVAGLTAIAELIERKVQILINTLSFARVGAFALAHAGLSAAIIALMDAAGSLAGKVLIVVVGNLVVIVLEGLVVSIQTTRLVLFEFFTRFLVAQGRVFRPLSPPPFLAREH
ncbi:MAG TPA: ATPase [Casimicrobiaceae bacterium]|nr:ATPase [Casimicrobiaceae bacterium]